MDWLSTGTIESGRPESPIGGFMVAKKSLARKRIALFAKGIDLNFCFYQP